MAYSVSKTGIKAAPPVAIAILIKIALAVAQSHGVNLDESQVWEIAMLGYSALIALINWLKNRKK